MIRTYANEYITFTTFLSRKEYERRRYGDIPRTLFVHDGFLEAYNAWRRAAHSNYRDRLWCLYCDYRDQIPPGTNAAIEGLNPV